MSRFFNWCMRHGAAFLFALAVVQFFVGLIPLVGTMITETDQMARHHGYMPESSGIPFGLELQLLFQAISSAAFPFFGALLIDRIDRWLATRPGPETRP